MDAGVSIFPERVFSLPGDPELAGAVFSSDGKAIFALTREVTFHFGILLDQSMPIWLGVICLPLAIIACFRMFAVLRTPREVSKRYCPACNYCVTHEGGTLPTCSECGLDLAKRKPIVGKSSNRRVLTIAFTSFFPTVLVWVVATKLSMTLGMFRLLDWHSAALGQRLDNPNNVDWWNWGLTLRQSLYRCDIATGEVVRIRDYDGATFCEIGTNPVTGDVYLQVGRDQLTLVDPQTGRMRARVRSADEVAIPNRESPLAIDHDPVTGTVFTSWQAWSPATLRSILASWNPQSEELQVIADNLPTEGDPANTSSRRFITKGDATRRFVLALPSFTEVNPGKQYPLHVYTQAQVLSQFQRTHMLDLGGNMSPHQAGVISLRDNLLILATANRRLGGEAEELRAFDLDALTRGEVQVRWNISVARSPHELLVLSPDETMLYALANNGIAEIALAERGIRRLLSPADRHFYPTSLIASSTHVLARSMRPLDSLPHSPQVPRSTDDIFVWRVR
jgi:hypothetical protein